MLRPEPDTFDKLMKQLLTERYGPTDRHRPPVQLDSPEVLAQRRRLLNEAMADDDGNVVRLAGRVRRVAA